MWELQTQISGIDNWVRSSYNEPGADLSRLMAIGERKHKLSGAGYRVIGLLSGSVLWVSGEVDNKPALSKLEGLRKQSEILSPSLKNLKTEIDNLQTNMAAMPSGWNEKGQYNSSTWRHLEGEIDKVKKVIENLMEALS